MNGKFQRCPSLQGIAARDCPGEEQDVINKRLDMSEVERIRTEIGEDSFLEYIIGNWSDRTWWIRGWTCQSSRGSERK